MTVQSCGGLCRQNSHLRLCRRAGILQAVRLAEMFEMSPEIFVARALHALRHTFLTNIANGIGMDEPVHIRKVMELAGHSNLRPQ